MTQTSRHYLDYNATAPVHPEVIDAVAAAMRRGGNASSVHAEGRAARAVVEDAREKLRALVNAPENGVIFTSGGTEAIHFALNGVVKSGGVKRILCSAIEHAAVPGNAEATGAEIETFPVSPSGVADLAALTRRLRDYDARGDGGFLVCLMLANNETGALQPVAAAAEIAHAHGGLLFVDAAQAIGKVPVDFGGLGADLMAVTAHKFGGPVGIGALIVRPDLPLKPVMRGGGQERNLRAGTSNVPGIAGFAKACELAPDWIAQGPRIAALRDRIERAARDAGATIWGAEAARLPGTLILSAPGFSASTQLMAMDLAGIAISSGSACSSGKTKPSHVLAAMGASEEEASSAIRVSLGWGSNDDDADAFVREWPRAYARVRARAA